jgi:predicted Holliday junction resolvase-like endonuclease
MTINIILGVLVLLLIGTTYWFYQTTIELKSNIKVKEAVHISERQEQDRTIHSVRDDLNTLAMNTSKVITDLRNELSKQVGRNKSIEVRTGLIMEKLVPFLDVFKHNPNDIVHLGMPIDFLCFDDDEIVIVEVKTGNAQLTPKQRAIKKLVEEKKVRFELIRLKVDPSKEEKDE